MNILDFMPYKKNLQPQASPGRGFFHWAVLHWQGYMDITATDKVGRYTLNWKC